MSESNKRKNITIKLVVLYFILAVACTCFAIIFHKINGVGIIEYFSKSENDVENIIKNETVIEEKNFEDIKRVDLSDTYKKNNLEEKTLNYRYGDSYDLEGNYQNKVEIEYTQISGLKDKEIENKINKKIEETCKSFISSSEENDDEIRNINIYTYVWGNFSNVISIYISKYVDYMDFEKDSEYYVDTLNLKLDTGEEISFDELFTPDASFKSIITQSAYNSICKKVNLEHYDHIEVIDDYENSKVNYSTVENTVYKILNEFNKDEEKKFYFTNFSIYLITDFENIEISMLNFYKYINIFNLVTPSESLYENGDTDADIYVFGEDFSKGFEFEGKISNYIYLTIYNYDKNYLTDDVENEYESFQIYEENIDKIKDFIVKYENSLNTNKGAFYNINSCYYGENNSLTFNCERLKIEKRNFEDNIKKVYEEASRAIMEAELIFCIGGIDEAESFMIVDKDGEFIVEKYEDFEL